MSARRITLRTDDPGCARYLDAARVTGSGRILVIDTATTRAVIALGEPDGTLVAERGWVAGYRHGEELLARIEALLADLDQAPAALGGVVVGTGPGAFTGLRVGIATAKGLAHALAPADRRRTDRRRAPARAPCRGTAGHPGRSGLRRAPAARGPVGSRPEPAGGAASHPARRHGPGARSGERLVAVDLDGRAPAEASALGAAAHDGLAAALLAAGAARFAAGRPGRPGGARAGVRDAAARGARGPARQRRGRHRWGTAPADDRPSGARPPRPPDDRGGPARGPAHRARVVHHALAAAGLPAGAGVEPPGPLPRGADRRPDRGLRRDLADGGRGARDHVRGSPCLPSPPHRRADAHRPPGPVPGSPGPRGDPRGSPVQPRRAPPLREVRLPARRHPAPLLQRQRGRRAHHDHGAAGHPGDARADRPPARGRRRRPGPDPQTRTRSPRPGSTARRWAPRSAPRAGEIPHERPAPARGGVQLRRDGDRARRGRAPDPRERGREPGGAPRADGRHRAGGRRPRAPALDRAGAGRGARHRRGHRARRGRGGGDVRPGPRGLAAGGHQLRQDHRLGAPQAARARQPPGGPRVRGLAPGPRRGGARGPALPARGPRRLGRAHVPRGDAGPPGLPVSRRHDRRCRG